MAVDLQSLTDGLALFRSGMEGVRSALGTWRDVRGLLPNEKGSESIERLKLPNSSYASPKRK